MAKVFIVSITSDSTISNDESMHLFLNEQNAKAFLKDENDKILKRITRTDGTISDEWYCESDENGYYYVYRNNGYWLKGELFSKETEDKQVEETTFEKIIKNGELVSEWTAPNGEDRYKFRVDLSVPMNVKGNEYVSVNLIMNGERQMFLLKTRETPKNDIFIIYDENMSADETEIISELSKHIQ